MKLMMEITTTMVGVAISDGGHRCEYVRGVGGDGATDINDKNGAC